MGLEVGSFPSDLVDTNPTGTDLKSQGDDHIRLIKRVIKNTFPNLNGAVNATPLQLNSLLVPGVVCFPGMIVMWSGAIGSIPSGWNLCNGAGTLSNGNPIPDLRDRFIVGSGISYSIGATGGTKDAVTVAHNHIATSIVNDPGHTHSGTTSSAGGGSSLGFDGYDRNNIPSVSVTGITVATTVSSAGVSGIDQNLPPYFALAFIIKN